MQSNRDHGTGAKLPKTQAGKVALPAATACDQSIVSTHPVLIALVRLLAREAAVECLAESGGSSPLPEKLDDQATEATQT